MGRKRQERKAPPEREETPQRLQDLSIPATPEKLAKAVVRGRKQPKP